MILVIDNYDSFVYNLVQYLAELGAETVVRRNDRITLDEVDTLGIDRIVISPGPGVPEGAGVSKEMILRYASSMPILGVCLGHQCIGEAFGGKVVRAERLMHGKTSLIRHDGKSIFESIANPFEATRYHSLIVERDSLPESLVVNAWTDEGEIMGFLHKEFPVWGVQFHPESILTREGKKLLANFLRQ
jgi:para-aminobenzoate synthetase component II